MPNIEMLSLLGKEFGVSLNELVEGKRLEETEFRAAADKNLASALERPVDRLLRWLKRYGGFAAVIFLLCCINAVITWDYYGYTRTHPSDTNPVGT